MASERPNGQAGPAENISEEAQAIGDRSGAPAPTETGAVADDFRADETSFEEDSILETIGSFVSSPLPTWRNLKRVLETSKADPYTDARMPAFRPAAKEESASRVWRISRDDLPSRVAFNAGRARLALYVFALVLALLGNSALLGPEGISRTPENTLDTGAPYLLLAFLFWLIAEAFAHRQALLRRWNRSDRLARGKWLARIVPCLLWLSALQASADSTTASLASSFTHLQDALGRFLAGLISWYLINVAIWGIRNRTGASPESSQGDSDAAALPVAARPPSQFRLFGLRIGTGRLVLILVLALSSTLLWINTSGNQISPPYILLWLISSVLWAMVFAPSGWNLWDWLSEKIDAWRRIRWREHRWVILAIVLIMFLGISFRVTDLGNIPPEMTSDHVEKIQDGYRVFNGDYKIFFPNNGGREPVQMYLLAALANLPGLGFDFFTLKVLAVAESILTLPILFWMGLELLGERRKKFNILVSLLLTALVAASYWHVIISRQALRIPLTPLVTALLLIFLARAMRHNKCSDYVKAGLTLGFGLYMYQAVRMLPVVVVVGVAVAMLVRRIGWRERFRYVVNLAVLVFVSLMIFLPMLHYAVEDPSHFWMRTTTRILGDDLGFATQEQAEAALRSNAHVFMQNVRNALLMFNWKGDIGWFNGAPQHPVLDIVTGSFLILGLAAWLVRMLKSRDPVDWFLPMVILIMLLPTILSLAHPDANPSNSRALGAVPAVYLVAALPIATMAYQCRRVIAGRTGKIMIVLFCAGIVLLANQRNAETYFEQYAEAYIGPSFPHSEAGEILRGFIESDGAPGNAFSVGYPFWWDYRALGIVAGYPLWPNDGWPIQQFPEKLARALRRSDEYRLVPDRDLLIFYNSKDEETKARLAEWFPEGRELVVRSYHPEDQFVLYRVPALGQSGWDQFFGESN